MCPSSRTLLDTFYCSYDCTHCAVIKVVILVIKLLMRCIGFGSYQDFPRFDSTKGRAVLGRARAAVKPVLKMLLKQVYWAARQVTCNAPMLRG